MSPELVPVSCLDQSKLEIGDNYLVAPIENPPTPYTYRSELVGKFLGLNALFEYQKSHQAQARKDGSSNKRKESGFNYFENFNEAVNTYLNNPASIVDFKECDDLIEGGESSGKSLIYDVTGDMLDVSRFLEGEPECMASLTNGNPRNKRVNIVVNISWWAGVDHTVINARGERIQRLVDWLESQGVRTQVIGVDSGECYHVEVIVKQFDEPLDLNDIAIIGHSDFLRRIMFRFCEYSDTFRSGYGDCTVFSRSFNSTKWESPYNEEYTVFVDGNGRDFRDDPPYVYRSFDKLEQELMTSLTEDSNKKVFKVL